MNRSRKPQIQRIKTVTELSIVGRFPNSVGYRVPVVVGVESNKQSEGARRLRDCYPAQLEASEQRFRRRGEHCIRYKAVTHILIRQSAFEISLRVGLRRAYKRHECSIIQGL
jgi:hypothetical protein